MSDIYSPESLSSNEPAESAQAHNILPLSENMPRGIDARYITLAEWPDGMVKVMASNGVIGWARIEDYSNSGDPF